MTFGTFLAGAFFVALIWAAILGGLAAVGYTLTRKTARDESEYESVAGVYRPHEHEEKK